MDSMKTGLQNIKEALFSLLVPFHSHQASDYSRFKLQYILTTHLFDQSLYIHNHEDLSGCRNLGHSHVPSTGGPSTYGHRANLGCVHLS